MCHGLLEHKTNGIKKWMPRRLFSLVLSVPPDRTKDELFSDSNSTEDSSCTKKKGGAERKPGMARMCAERESVTHVVWYKTRCVGAIPSYLCLCVCMYVYRHIFLPLQTHCGQDEKKGYSEMAATVKQLPANTALGHLKMNTPTRCLVKKSKRVRVGRPIRHKEHILSLIANFSCVRKCLFSHSTFWIKILVQWQHKKLRALYNLSQ